MNLAYRLESTHGENPMLDQLIKDQRSLVIFVRHLG